MAVYSKVNLKIPQIVRWRVAGISDKKIAELLNMTHAGLARILALPEYKEFEASYLQGYLTDMDRKMAGRVEDLHHELQAAVPAALRCLVETVTQKRDLRAALDAAKEIFDRDPDKTFAKNKTSGLGAEDPQLPDAVIDAAAEEGNRVAEAAPPPPKPN